MGAVINGAEKSNIPPPDCPCEYLELFFQACNLLSRKSDGTGELAEPWAGARGRGGCARRAEEGRRSISCLLSPGLCSSQTPLYSNKPRRIDF